MAADPSKPTNLDPGSPEYLCKVHGKCNMKTGADPTSADRSEGPVSPKLEDAKSFHEATEEAGLPNPENMNPASEEFMCKIHGQCNAPNATAIKPLPNATTIAAQCRANANCRCKIFGVCQGSLTTEPNDKYPLHHAAHYCKYYALCANDLPEHLRGPEWRSSSAILPPPTQPQAPKAALKPAEPSKEVQPETSPAVVPAKAPPPEAPASSAIAPSEAPAPSAIGEMPVDPVVIPAAPIAPVVVPAAGQPLPAVVPVARPLGTPMGGAQAEHFGEQVTLAPTLTLPLTLALALALAQAVALSLTLTLARNPNPNPNQGGVPISVVPPAPTLPEAPVAAAVQPAGVGSDIPGANPIAPLASESSSAELPFRPDDASTCVSLSPSTTDDWCQNTCAKSCPPQICTCEGERKPVQTTNPDGTPYIGSAGAEAVPPAVSPLPLTIPAATPQLVAKDPSSCITVSTSVTDQWCVQS